MLIHLSIHHFAVVEHLELDFKNGMTVLTGETGAGKSILIDALGLTIGDRADPSMVRPGNQQAEVSASYEISTLPELLAWLNEKDLDAESECIIRRTISGDGKSRAFINGRVVPLQQLKELGQFLVDIHGQHQHQSLMRMDHQRRLLDEYANHPELTNKVRKNYTELQNLRKEYKELMALQGQSDKLALLQYQIQEMDELNLQDQELEALETEHKELSSTEQWLGATAHAVSSLENDSGEGAIPFVQLALNQMLSLKSQTKKLDPSYELLKSALIQLEEAGSELKNFQENLNLDPARLVQIDQRLSQIHAMARKHRIDPGLLLEHREKLKREAAQLTHLQTSLESITQQLTVAEQAYQNSSKTLSASRKKIALQLEDLITKSLHRLEMPNGRFKIEFLKDKEESGGPNGIDEIDFLVSTNPGLSPQPLRKIASGGELSRISLAIQVITAQKMTIPTLIFDEVDAGISGKTAETVGRLLQTLSQNTQVFCVTHLPQIAALGKNHYKVEKKQTKDSTHTLITALDGEEKIQELARMLGGATITKHALAHAKEMLETA